VTCYFNLGHAVTAGLPKDRFRSIAGVACGNTVVPGDFQWAIPL
jgi:hypothetical protein